MAHNSGDFLGAVVGSSAILLAAGSPRQAYSIAACNVPSLRGSASKDRRLLHHAASYFYDFDKHNPEGVTSVFEKDGRLFVAFCASGTAEDGNRQARNTACLPEKLSAQGDYVYALPKGSTK